MNLTKIATSLAALSLVGIAIADDKQHVEIAVIKDHGDHDATVIQLDSDDLNFNLREMQEGENQAIVDEQGRTILVTREADGYTFNVDGKTISVPIVDGGTQAMAMMHGEHAENIEVEVIHEIHEGDGKHEGPHEIRVVKKIEVVED